MIKEELAALQERIAKLQQMASNLEGKGDTAKKHKEVHQAEPLGREAGKDLKAERGRGPPKASQGNSESVAC